MRVVITIFLVLIGLTAPKISAAETAYSWTDSSGRVFYGSTPPKNAKSVSPVKAKTFSRYSSDRMIKGFSYKKAPSAVKSKSKESKGTPVESAMNEVDIIQPDPPRAKMKGAVSLDPPHLASDPVTIEVNDDKQVTGCRVNVKNTGGLPATNISVSFMFKDGSIVPAYGPVVLEAGEVAEYLIPKAGLPLDLKSEPAAPEVVLNFLENEDSEATVPPAN